MDCDSFQKLQLQAKYQLLEQKGQHLAHRFYLGYEVSLYGIENYYAEVWKRIGLNYIEWIEAFEGGKSLDPYLEHIPIAQMLKSKL